MAMENHVIQITKKLGKERAAKKLMISVRYVNMILAGKKHPSKRLDKLAQIYLMTQI